MEAVKNDIEASSVVCPGYLLKGVLYTEDDEVQGDLRCGCDVKGCVWGGSRKRNKQVNIDLHLILSLSSNFEFVLFRITVRGGCSLADAICSAIDLTEAIASSTCSETLLEKLHPAKYGSILKTHDLTEEKGNPKNSGHLRICPSYNLKQIQSLNGKITALSRFLSRPAEN
ncbi:hypothetical protein Tco_1012524 [Tanacetum coccineum]